MHGFKPSKAHAAAQNFADGGMVGRIKGALGFKPADPEKDARIAAARAEYRAERDRSKQAAQAPAAPAPAPQKAISGYASGNGLQQRMKAAGVDDYKDGGMVRGPGTGTSDDVPDKVPEGSYIMPADSTQAMGAPKLQGLGAKNIPVNLSNGEFKLPPEQVHAVGVRALDQMKNATHTPAARGFHPGAQQGRAPGPRTFFADGGMVENDVTRMGNSYSGGNVAGNITVNGQAPGGTYSENPGGMAAAPTPAASAAPVAGVPAVGAPPVTPVAATPSSPPPAAAPMGWAERNAQRNAEVTASSILPSSERDAAQASLKPAAATPPPPPLAPPASPPAVQQFGAPATAPEAGSLAQRPAPVFGQRPQVRGYASGGMVEDERRRQLVEQIPTSGMRAPASDGAQDSPLNNELGRNITNTVRAIPGAAAVPFAGARAAGALAGLAGRAAPAATVTGQMAAKAAPAGVPLLGAAGIGAAYNADKARPQVAASPGGAGRGVVNPPLVDQPQPVRNYDPSVASQAPAQAMPLSAVAMRDPGAAPGLQQEAPTAGAQQPAGQAAPTVRHSGNDWAARKALENAATSASSITNDGGRFDRHGKAGSPAQAAYGAMLANDMALQGAQPGMDQAAMRENGANSRASMQEAGANQRADRGFKTEQQRAAIEAKRAAIEGRRADSEITGLGFKLREAQQHEQLRNVLLNPNATPEQKRQAQQARLSLSGEGDKWKSVALQGGTDAQGIKTESILGAVNERTGEMKRMEQGQGGAAQPIGQNTQAISIRDNPNISREQKAEALRKLGYS